MGNLDHVSPFYLGNCFPNFSQGTCLECGSSAYGWDLASTQSINKDRDSSGSQNKGFLL